LTALFPRRETTRPLGYHPVHPILEFSPCPMPISLSYPRVRGMVLVRLKIYPHSQALINGTFGVQSSVRPSSWLSYFGLKARPSMYTGIGLFFSAFMICLTAIQARYTAYSPKNSEEFSSASRSVKPGLIASGIVSAWTWAATLVSSQFPYTPSIVK
jgi:hypothetical protein